MTETTESAVTAAEGRAAMLMKLAGRVIRENAADAYPIHYDDADCDGYCLADDLEASAEELTPASQEADHVADAGKMVSASQEAPASPTAGRSMIARMTTEEFEAATLADEGGPVLVGRHEDLPASPSPGLREQIAENANCSGLREAVIEECAKVCEAHSWARGVDWWLTVTKKDATAEAARECAAAIRALSRPVSEREGPKPHKCPDCGAMSKEQAQCWCNNKEPA